MNGKFFPSEAVARYAARHWNQNNCTGASPMARAEQCGSGWVVAIYDSCRPPEHALITDYLPGDYSPAMTSAHGEPK